MSRNEKQAFEEMAKDVTEAIKHNSAVDVIRHGLICVNGDGTARELFDDGYRKQSAWISVDERLPEPRKAVLVFCRNGFNTFQSVSEMLDKNGRQWSAVCGIPVTHWMPLPEPLKGE